MKLLTTSVALCISLISASSANAALVASADGQTVYDTDLNVTWLANANLAASNTFGVSGINSDGAMSSWNTAQSWIAAMNTANYLGYHDWRLPTTNPVNGSAFNYSTSFNGSTDYGLNVSAPGTTYAGSPGSEMAHLFYDELGNKGYCDPVTSTASSCSSPQGGFGLTNTGLFSNLKSNFYWSGTEYAPNTTFAWGFDFSNGYQLGGYGSGSYVLAVLPGNVAAVPVPSAAWLFGSGLIGLVSVARKSKTSE